MADEIIKVLDFVFNNEFVQVMSFLCFICLFVKCLFKDY